MVSKIRRLSPERLSELEATIGRMLEAQEDLAVQEFGQSRDVLARIWDNPDDAEYDRL
ncbi:MAG TPA: toxin-antitoxin system, antitoxin component, Xre family protein [Thermoanaerobaculia bacterium]|nr:toxin-antitoxin system, antitoxin component, Xre family protein [Thermoanaerobaculia bacterium]